MKICSNKNCIHNGQPQPFTNFTKNRTAKSGYNSQCKDCYKEYIKNNYQKKLELDKRWRDKNSEKIKNRVKEYDKEKCLFLSVNGQVLFLNQYEECRQDLDKPEFLQARCTYCGGWFNPTNREVTNRVRAINGNYAGESRIYCSANCKLACPTYRQRLYPKTFKKNTSREVNSFLRKIVLERDNYQCQKCGKDKNEVILHCHHIDPVIKNSILSEDPENCLTLCKDCHKIAHLTISGCSYHELKKCQNK